MAKLYELKYHEDEFPQKREMTREEIIFLTSLQKEMNTQDHVSQADPRFWVIRGTERKYHIDANEADGLIFYHEGNSYTEEEFKDKLLDNIFPEIFDDGDYRFEYNGEGMDSSLSVYEITENDGEKDEEEIDWYSGIEEIIEFLDDKGYSFDYSGYEDVPFIYPGPIFLTHKAANEHLMANAHHYSEDAHPYALTAWRCPEIEKLYDMLHNVDFENIDHTIKSIEKFDNVKQHIDRLAGDYKCWDNRLTEEEAVELSGILATDKMINLENEAVQINMKMPEGCGYCRFKWTGDSCNYCTAQVGDKHGHRNIHVIDNEEFYSSREESCPLINVRNNVSDSHEADYGEWIDIMVGDMPAQACSKCRTFYPLSYTGGGHHFCPNSGAKMILDDISNELDTYTFTFLHGLDNSYNKVEIKAESEEDAKKKFYDKVGENFEHRILYIKKNDKIIYEF